MSFAVDGLQGMDCWLNRVSVPITNITPARAHSKCMSALLWGNTNATKHRHSTATAWRHEPSGKGETVSTSCFDQQTPKQGMKKRLEAKTCMGGLGDFPSLLLLLSHFSRVQFCATPQTAAHQAPPSVRFSRQEYWSGLPFPSPMHENKK